MCQFVRNHRVSAIIGDNRSFLSLHSLFFGTVLFLNKGHELLDAGPHGAPGLGGPRMLLFNLINIVIEQECGNYD
jgi:hypothetical protein